MAGATAGGHRHGGRQPGTGGGGGGGGGGSTGIQGSVTNQSGGAAVAAGYAQIYDNAITSKLFEVAIDGSGNYALTGMAAATYQVRYDPPPNFGVGTSEPTWRTVVVVSGQMTRQDFVAKAAPAGAFDNFSSYTTDAQLRNAGAIVAGDFFFGVVNGEISSVSNANGSYGNIARANAGPNGTDQVMRYTWNGGAPGTLPNGGTIQTSPRINPPPVAFNEICWSMLQRLSAGFNVGDSQHSGSQREYKSNLLKLGPSVGGTLPQIGVYFEQGSNGAQKKITMDVTDRGSVPVSGFPGCNLNTTRSIASVNYPDDGAYHRITVRGYNMCGGQTSTFELWLDETMIQTMSGVFLPQISAIGGAGSGQLVVFEPGSNMNNGPDASETRDWAELQFALTRTSVRAGRA